MVVPTSPPDHSPMIFSPLGVQLVILTFMQTHDLVGHLQTDERSAVRRSHLDVVTYKVLDFVVGLIEEWVVFPTPRRLLKVVTPFVRRAANENV